MGVEQTVNIDELIVLGSSREERGSKEWPLQFVLGQARENSLEGKWRKPKSDRFWVQAGGFWDIKED